MVQRYNLGNSNAAVAAATRPRSLSQHTCAAWYTYLDRFTCVFATAPTVRDEQGSRTQHPMASQPHNCTLQRLGWLHASRATLTSATERYVCQFVPMSYARIFRSLARTNPPSCLSLLFAATCVALSFVCTPSTSLCRSPVASM